MTETTTAEKVAAAKAANEAKQAPKIAAAKATRAAAKASPAKSKPVAKPAVDKTICRWGQGRYHSPANAKSCSNAKAPKKELCAEHEIAMRAATKASRPATPKAAKLAVVKSKPATMESEIAAVRKMKAAKPQAVAALVAPDAMAICNGCGVNSALPGSAAGYCADCEAAAKAATVDAPVAEE